MHQGIAGEDPGHAPVALGKAQQQVQDQFHLLQAHFLFRRDLVDEAQQAGLDEFDEALEHLGLAGEVTIEGGLGAFEAGGQGGRGDFLALGLFQHGRQGLQYLQLAFAGLAGHGASPPCCWWGNYSWRRARDRSRMLRRVTST